MSLTSSVLFFLFVSLFSYGQLPDKEQKALQDLHRFTNGTEWKITWDIAEKQARNHGIEIVDNHVVRLDLRNNNLVGELPSSLSDLEYLEYLNLSDNVLSGELPDLDDLKRLSVLILNNNKLSGNLPESLGKLKNLKTMEFTDNFFSNSKDFEYLEPRKSVASYPSNSE